MSRVFAFLLLLLTVLPALADDIRAVTTVKDTKRPNLTHEMHLWLPDGVDPIRGLVVMGAYTGLKDRSDYQHLARDLQFGILAGGMQRKGNTGQAALDAMKHFAAELKRPEIEHVPIVTGGLSVGGGMAISLGLQLPDRVICVFSNGNPGTGLGWIRERDKDNDEKIKRFDEKLETYRVVPTITVNGSKDPFVDYDKEVERYWHNKFHPFLRGRRMRWGLAMQWGYGHSHGNTNALAWPMIAECIRLRVPADHDFRKGPAKLKTIPEDEGWLGDVRTWETNFATIAPFDRKKIEDVHWTWLVSEDIAVLWRGFVAHHPPVKLVMTPKGKAGEGVKLSLEGELPANTKQVAYLRGATSLGVVKASPFAMESDDVNKAWHSVAAIVTLADGQRIAVRPVLYADLFRRGD